MRWDDERKRYYLTEKALADSGTDIREMLSANDTVRANTIINNLLVQVSNIIYNYIYSHSAYNERQDYIIANCPSMRRIMLDAMIAQASYLMLVGDPGKTLDESKRTMTVDVQAKEILNTTIRELGISILYGGY